MNRLLLLIITSFTLQSCTPIFYGITGIRTPKALSETQIQKAAQKWDIPIENSFVLDTGVYKNTIRKKVPIEQQNNHLQPLQAYYFQPSTPYPVSYHINCYAGGFPNLKWNRNGNMDVFPPRQQAPIDSAITLSDLMNSIQQSESKLFQQNGNQTVVVFWTKFMNRQTKRFLKAVRKNSALSNQFAVTIIYMNADNLFVNEP